GRPGLPGHLHRPGRRADAIPLGGVALRTVSHRHRRQDGVLRRDHRARAEPAHPAGPEGSPGERAASRGAVPREGRRALVGAPAALLPLEATDVVFAVDSVPAIFALTDEPFIVFTSNIFAILGLRSMYFMLGGAVARFHLLRYGLALVLVFVGLKM